MDKEIIQLLKSSNPDDRIEGINRLETSGHPDTVKILGALYKKETDPEVKALAASVARKIKEGGASASAGDSKRSSGRRNPAAAKAHLEKAMDSMIAFQNDEAWIHAKKAFLADPELAEDDYAMGLASEITGADRTTAVETLLGGGGFANPEKPKRGEKGKSSNSTDRVGWGKALAGIGILALLNGLVVAIPIALFGTAFTTLIATLASDPSLATLGGGTFAIIAGVVAIIMIIFTMIGIFISYGLIHFSATTFLGGDGYFTNLLYNIRIPLITQFVLQTVIGGIIVFLFFSTFASIDPVEFEAAMATGDSSYISGIEDNANTIQVLNALTSLINLGFFIWASIVIGKTYDFGGVKGCLSIIISSIVMFVAICGCSFAIFMVFANSIDTSSFQ